MSVYITKLLRFLPIYLLLMIISTACVSFRESDKKVFRKFKKTTILPKIYRTDFEGKELDIKKAIVRSSGGSDASIRVSQELDIEASGASDVYLYGNPKIVNKKVSGASDFHRRS